MLHSTGDEIQTGFPLLGAVNVNNSKELTIYQEDLIVVSNCKLNLTLSYDGKAF